MHFILFFWRINLFPDDATIFRSSLASVQFYLSKNVFILPTFLFIQFSEDKHTFSEVSDILFHCLLDSIAVFGKSAVGVNMYIYIYIFRDLEFTSFPLGCF